MNLNRFLYLSVIILYFICCPVHDAYAINDLDYFPYDSGNWWEYLVKYAYSGDLGHRFRWNPAT